MKQNDNTSTSSRRSFIKKAAAGAASVFIVPRHVLGGPGYTAPSDQINLAAIGAGGKGASDIRNAAAEFDGPTVAYATDTCASGGYWIASGCDELWAREASIVGSIGVIGSRVNVAGLADRLGVSYERFAAGKYKDAGVALKEMDDDERAYLQGIIDDFYDHFVARVAEGRDVDEAAIRDTEARVFVGTDAHERGLVDGLGARDTVEARMADLLDRDEVSVEAFRPQKSLAARLRGGASAVAYALGAGVAGRVVGDEADPLKLRF